MQVYKIVLSNYIIPDTKKDVAPECKEQEV